MASTQSHYRFGLNSGTESTHGFYAAEDTNPLFGAIALDTTFLLRFCIQSTTNFNNVAPQFQYRLNGGTWTNITTSSNVARAVATSVYAEGDNTTQRLSGTGTFETSSAGCTEDGLAGGNAMDIVANGNAETVCSIQLRSADLVAGNLVEFRVINTATPLDTYAVIPALGVPLSASVSETASPRDWFIAAAIGASMISAGMQEAPVKIQDTVSAQLVIPISQTETFKVSDIVAAEIPTNINVTENFKADDGGFVELRGLGNPLKITDGPVAAELLDGSIFTVSISESLKVADGLSILLDSDDHEVTQTESAKIDDGGFVELRGLGNPIRITDGPVIATLITGDDLSTSPSESLKVIDTVSASIFGGVSTTESLKADDGGFVELRGLGNPIKITDGPIVATLTNENERYVNLSETFEVSDSVTVNRIPLEVFLTEVHRIADSGEAELSRDENLRVVDTVTASLFNFILSATLSESLKVVDELSALVGGIATAPSETFRVADTVTAFIGMGAASSESLKVADQLTASIGLLASVSESLKVSDTVTAEKVENNLDRAVTAESLKVADALSVSIDLSAVITESLKVSDAPLVTIDLLAQASESLKVVDTFSASTDLLQTQISEDLKVADALFASQGQGTSLTESLKVVDTLTVSISRIDALVSESFVVADTQTVTLDPLQTQATESLKVVDIFSASAGLEASLTESLKVVDTLSTLNTQLEASASESLKVSDGNPSALLTLIAVLSESLVVSDSTPVGYLNPLQLAVSESLKVVEETPAITTGTTIAAQPVEGLKVTEVLVAALDPEEATSSESIEISDAIEISISPELAEVSESLRVVDTLQVELSIIQVSLEESLKVEDNAPRFGGPRILETTGAYVTTIETTGEYL